MVTRRQEKVARVVKEAVSDAIAHHLNDPRIVEMAPDLRNAEVYLSIFSQNDATGNKTFEAISHAKSRIQSLLAGRVQSKFCPVLRFHRDEKFKKTLETMKLIDQATSELSKKSPDDDEEEVEE